MRKQLFKIVCVLFGASTLLAHETTQQTNPPSTFQRGKEMRATTPSGPRAADGVNLNLSVDFLWWKATQDGLAYATSGVLSNVGNDLTSRGEQKTPDFGWDPGFKEDGKIKYGSTMETLFSLTAIAVEIYPFLDFLPNFGSIFSFFLKNN